MPDEKRLKEEFERDVEEIKALLGEMVSRYTIKIMAGKGRAGESDNAGVKPPAKTLVDFAMQMANDLSENYGPYMVQMATVSYCLRAAAPTADWLGSGDIGMIQKGRESLASAVASSAKAIMALRKGRPTTLKGILDALEAAYGAQKSAGEPQDLFRSLFDSNIASLPADEEKVRRATEEVIDILAGSQLLLGIVLKWSLIAESLVLDKVKVGVKDADWAKAHREWLAPLLAQVSSFGTGPANPGPQKK